MPVTPTELGWTATGAFEFGGVRLLDTDLDSAVRSIESAAEQRASQGLHLCNAYTLTLAARRDDYRRMLGHEHSINLPDGTPVTWYYRLAKRSQPRGPVRGPSLMKATLERTSLRHFLLGGTEPLLRDLQAVITTRFPKADVAGAYAPPFRDPTEEDLQDFSERIRRSGAQVVWVGLGTPRQDRVIAALVGRVDAVFVGVGAAFDFISGHKPEAPAFLHHSGLEWAYRLAHEPRRLWRRYLIGNTLFLAHAARQLASRRVEADEARTDDAPDSAARAAVGQAHVDLVDEEGARAAILDAANERSGRPWLVVTPNIQHIALLETDQRLRATYERADLVLADGWPVVAAIRTLHGRKIQRITGADLFPALCLGAARRGLTVGIVGGMFGAAAEAARRLSAASPGLEVAIILEPPLGFDQDPDQVRAVVEKVRAADVDLLFLALGAPKQELFAAQNLEQMNAGVTLCIGAAVDFVAGRQRRAPLVLRRLGLEWAFRAVHEPRRLLPRYARSAPVFVAAVARAHRRRCRR